MLLDIDKHRSEFELGELTSYELGIRKLNEFLKVNEAENSFNKKQKIILIASDFDEQTLSAVSWLINNRVDMSCIKLTPYKVDGIIYLHAEKLLPVANYADYYVNLMDKTLPSPVKRNKGGTRRTLPKIDAMLNWGVVKAGDIIIAKDRGDEGMLLPNGNIMVDAKEQSMQAWLRDIYGWSSVQTYVLPFIKIAASRYLRFVKNIWNSRQGNLLLNCRKKMIMVITINTIT
ncbi:hypothetical protein [Bacillus sp. FJAT-29814]|uniref:hypothetical protein n=1 Tax=Bacillus sp. FJAT-29814 TaxID=1729688 RepID=UPI000AF8D46A|nr:hypothetical protein [Bacillus sp. FJAT-29814]